MSNYKNVTFSRSNYRNKQNCNRCAAAPTKDKTSLFAYLIKEGPSKLSLLAHFNDDGEWRKLYQQQERRTKFEVYRSSYIKCRSRSGCQLIVGSANYQVGKWSCNSLSCALSIAQYTYVCAFFLLCVRYTFLHERKYEWLEMCARNWKCCLGNLLESFSKNFCRFVKQICS